MNEVVNDIDEKRQAWFKRLTIIVAIWGILSLLFSSTLFGVVFILFAVLIYVSRSSMAIYALGIILWILGIAQLLNAAGITNLGFAQGAAQGTELILVAIANLAIGALIIYRTWKLE
ncbi:MAG: hypothetical protein LLF83_00380 [Methanobacterium sp.]|nr:hypothetical protein [Methanobacterium sp.]